MSHNLGIGLIEACFGAKGAIVGEHKVPSLDQARVQVYFRLSTRQA